MQLAISVKNMSATVSHIYPRYSDKWDGFSPKTPTAGVLVSADWQQKQTAGPSFLNGISSQLNVQC